MEALLAAAPADSSDSSRRQRPGRALSDRGSRSSSSRPDKKLAGLDWRSWSSLRDRRPGDPDWKSSSNLRDRAHGNPDWKSSSSPPGNKIEGRDWRSSSSPPAHKPLSPGPEPWKPAPRRLQAARKPRSPTNPQATEHEESSRKAPPRKSLGGPRAASNPSRGEVSSGAKPCRQSLIAGTLRTWIFWGNLRSLSA